MADLPAALKLLAHADWDEVPSTGLASYLQKHFEAGELLCNSVPLPPNGGDPEAIEPHFQTPDSAKSAKDIFPSPVRPQAPDDDHESLRKNWGKPVKFSAKENPLQIALYKMAGHDRHGAWFARHSIFEGISFSKFKKAIKREFPETLLTQGEPGAGAIRGLSAERRIEQLKEENGDRVEVYQLSAQMPPPVSPREFLMMLFTTDCALTEKSPTADQQNSQYIPRHYMIVSKGLHHPDVPERPSFVRGTYESVELVREIPIHLTHNTDPELNPLEWIMVTRSDPAGGIPRFLIDRGTPGAMLADVSKFFNWACGQEEIPERDGDLEEQQAVSAQDQDATVVGDGSQAAQAADGATSKPLDVAAQQVTDDNSAQRDVSNKAATKDLRSEPAAGGAIGTTDGSKDAGGILSSLTSTVQSGITTYAPVGVSNFVTKHLSNETSTAEAPEDDLSDSSSDDSFLSADELKRLSTAPEYSESNNEGASLVSGASSMRSLPNVDKKNMSRHEKEVLKIMQQREKLDEKVAKKREAEEAKFQAAKAKDETDQDKARERMEKELKKTQERHEREVEKLEQKREKELRKVEEKRARKENQNKLSLVARERDDLRSHVDLLRRENSLLADQVESLQRENTALANRVGKLGGPDALRSVQDELKKTTSLKSTTSRVSLDSMASGSGEKRDSKEVAAS